MKPRGRQKKHIATPEERVIDALLTLLDNMQIDHVGDGYDIGYNQALYDITKRLRDNADGNQQLGTTSGGTRHEQSAIEH